VTTLNIPDEGDDNRLPLRASKVVPFDKAGRLSHAEQDALAARCPGWACRETLRTILTLTSGRRTVYLSKRALLAAVGRDWANVKRHRAALVAAGILEPRGGGYHGQVARYWIRTPDEADAWLLEEAERDQAAAGCPICHEQPATHKPIRCPDFGRFQPRLEGT
jgi:hypothetical protein